MMDFSFQDIFKFLPTHDPKSGSRWNIQSQPGDSPSKRWLSTTVARDPPWHPVTILGWNGPPYRWRCHEQMGWNNHSFYGVRTSPIFTYNWKMGGLSSWSLAVNTWKLNGMIRRVSPPWWNPSWQGSPDLGHLTGIVGVRVRPIPGFK